MREADLQHDIRLALADIDGAVMWRNNAGADTRTGYRYGLITGASDLIGLANGRFVALEIKTPRGVVSPAQRRFIDLVNDLGGYACVVRSVDEAVEAVRAAMRGEDAE